MSRDFILQGIADYKGLLARLERVDAGPLSEPERIDLQLLMNNIRAAVRGLEEYRLWGEGPGRTGAAWALRRVRARAARFRAA